MAQERGVGDQDKNQMTAPHWLTPPVNQETWIGLLFECFCAVEGN